MSGLINSAGSKSGVIGFVNNVCVPAFLAYPSSDKSVAAYTTEKVANDTELLDSHGCYNHESSTVTLNGISTPSYSFAPHIAGWYFIVAITLFDNFSGVYISSKVLKNDSVIASADSDPGSGYSVTATASIIAYADGVDDFFHQECKNWHSGSETMRTSGGTECRFQAFRIS